MSPISWNRHPRGELSAYVDGELSAGSATKIDAHLGTCAECSATVTQLRALRGALATLPEIPAPRSFALTPAQVAPGRTVTSLRANAGLVNGLRLGSAGLALALAVVILVDAGSGSDDGAIQRASLSMLSPTPEWASDADAGVPGWEMYPPEATGAPEPEPETAYPTIPPEAGGVGGGSSGGDTGSSAGGGAGSATPPPAATDNDIVYESGGDDEAADDGSGDDAAGESMESASTGDSDSGWLALEVILAVGAVLTLIGSVVVSRSRWGSEDGTN